MTFGILTINHRRPKILELFCASMKRLRREIGIDFPVICVSDAEDSQICSKYNVGHITQANIPVSEKWNTACLYMKQLAVDYIIVLGSDDIMATNTLQSIINAMNSDLDMIGIKSLYVYDTDGVNKGNLIRVSSKIFLGVGKTLNKRVLDAVDWKPWTDSMPRNYGMDAILTRNVSPHIKTSIEIFGMIVDCKSKQSLNKFTMLKSRHGKTENRSLFLNILSPEERAILNSMIPIGLPIKFPNLHKKGRTLI